MLIDGVFYITKLVHVPTKLERNSYSASWMMAGCDN